jgi:hypothetical protein
MAAEAAWVIAIIALMAFIVAAIALAVTLNIYRVVSTGGSN